MDSCCPKRWAPFCPKRSRTVKTLAKIKHSGISHVVNDQWSTQKYAILGRFVLTDKMIHLEFRITPDSSSIGESPAASADTTAISPRFARGPAHRVNSLRASIRGEGFRSSLLARQRRQTHNANENEPVRQTTSLSTQPIDKRALTSHGKP